MGRNSERTDEQIHMRRVIPAVLVAVLLTTAGCSGLTGDEPTEDVSATPMDVPEDPTYPPGVTENGVESVSTLLHAHKEALAKQSVTFHQETTATRICSRVSASDGEAFSCENSSSMYDGFIHGQYLENRSHFLTHTRSESATIYDDYTVRSYADGERVYVNQTRSDNSTYRIAYGPDGEPTDPRKMMFVNLDKEGVLTNYLHTMNVVSVERIQDSPTELYRITARDFEKEDQFTNDRGYEAVSDGSLSLVVAETGAIQSYNVSYTFTDEKGRVRFEQTVTYSDWGNTTIEEPDWLSKVNESDAQPPESHTATATAEGR